MIFFVRKSLLVYILVLIQQSCWASEIMKTYFLLWFCFVFSQFLFLACLLRLSIHFIFSDNVHCTYFVLILQCMKVQNKLTESNRNKVRSNCFQMWTLYRLCYTSTKYCYHFLPCALYECMNLVPGSYFLLKQTCTFIIQLEKFENTKGVIRISKTNKHSPEI
jgi:hypothetical protein